MRAGGRSLYGGRFGETVFGVQPAVWQGTDASTYFEGTAATGQGARTHSFDPARSGFVLSGCILSRACHTPQIGLFPVEADAGAHRTTRR